MEITDTAPDGAVTVTPVHAGDVLPLVPDSLDANMRSLEKAVTFDFPTACASTSSRPSTRPMLPFSHLSCARWAGSLK